jgi:hypothetical protein
LQRVVTAGAATVTIQVHGTPLWKGPIQLALNETSGTQIARQSRTKRVICDTLSDRDRLASHKLLLGLVDESIRDLVDGWLVCLREMYAMGSGVRNVRKKAPGQLALDVQIPLLHISSLLQRVTRRL